MESIALKNLKDSSIDNFGFFVCEYDTLLGTYFRLQIVLFFIVLLELSELHWI